MIDRGPSIEMKEVQLEAIRRKANKVGVGQVAGQKQVQKLMGRRGEWCLQPQRWSVLKMNLPTVRAIDVGNFR